MVITVDLKRKPTASQTLAQNVPSLPQWRFSEDDQNKTSTWFFLDSWGVVFLQIEIW